MGRNYSKNSSGLRGSKKKAEKIVRKYKRAINSKVSQAVDEEIVIIQLMEIYGQKYSYFTDEIDANIYDIMKGKLIEEHKKSEKDAKKK